MEKVFIRLIEGVETLVPVESKALDDNIFEIVSNSLLDLEEDVTSIWEFYPGDIVRCEKTKGVWVAKELISSSFKNRKMYQLIFKIVYTAGNIDVRQLQEFKDEIFKLCNDGDFPQNRHPIVQEWLKKNCNNLF